MPVGATHAMTDRCTKRAMAGGLYHKSTHTFPAAIPPKRLTYKGRIRGIYVEHWRDKPPEWGIKWTWPCESVPPQLTVASYLMA